MSTGAALPAEYHVFARYRHAPSPGQDQPHFQPAIEATLSPVGSAVYIAGLPNPGEFIDTQLVEAMWVIERHFPDGTAEVKSSEVIGFQVGCASSGLNDFLIAEQAAILARFPREGMNLSLQEILDAGFEFPTHGWACTEGMGLPVANQDAPSPPTASAPRMCFFVPHDPTKYVEDQSDDAPYNLIGWGYAADFVPSARPTLACVPYQQWFIHEAGFHTPDGGFGPTPPQGESPPGSMTATPPVLPRPDWHDRLWDLHLWVNRAGPLPTLSINAPMTVPGLTPPSGSFFFAPVPP